MRGKHKVLKSVFRYIVVIVLLSGVLASIPVSADSCSSYFNGGQGTATSPYQVNTAAQLSNINSCLGSSGSSYYFVQTANISLSAYNTGTGWTPIGSSADPFYGFYDGSGYTISDLYINQYEYNTPTTGPSSFILGLFGYTQNATIINTSVTGISVTGGGDIGGIVGSANATNIDNSSSSGQIEGRYRLGGLVGSDQGSSITDSNSSVNVIGDGDEDTAGADLDEQSYQQGGLVGYMSSAGGNGTIDQSYSTGNISGFVSAQDVREQVGGLVGAMWGASNSILNSYERGNVNGGTYNVGGLVGRVATTTASISNSYATGQVMGTSTETGGLVGGIHNSVSYVGSNNFWDEDTTDQTSSGGTIELGESTSSMTSSTIFTNAGWDFNSIWTINSGVNNGYPYLQPSYLEIPIASSNGSISPSTAQLAGDGQSIAFTMSPDSGYEDDISGTCDGNLSSETYTTNSTNIACTVIDNFSPNQYTLTFATQGGSTVSPITQAYNSSVTLPTAPTRAHYTFTGWNSAADGSGTSYGTSGSLTMPLNGETIYAQWVPDQYSLEYSAQTGGTISGEINQTVNYTDSGTTVTAIPDYGYVFTGWSDGVTNASRTDIGVSQNINVTAEFSPVVTQQSNPTTGSNSTSGSQSPSSASASATTTYKSQVTNSTLTPTASSSDSTQTKIYLNNYSSYKENKPQSLSLQPKTIVYFTAGNKLQSAIINNISNNSVTLTFSPKTYVATIRIGQTVSYDTLNSGTKDMKLSLQSITNGVAQITFQKLAIKKAGHKSSVSKLFLLILIVVILGILIWVVRYLKTKKTKKA